MTVYFGSNQAFVSVTLWQPWNLPASVSEKDYNILANRHQQKEIEIFTLSERLYFHGKMNLNKTKFYLKV